MRVAAVPGLAVRAVRTVRAVRAVRATLVAYAGRAGQAVRGARGVAAVAGLCVALSACGGSGDVEAATLSARIEALEAQIALRIGPALCRADEDCRALPIGALACGGPSRFLPYSVVGTDESALERAAEEHRRLSAEQVKAAGTVGPCMMLSPPLPRCERSRLACTF